MKRMVRQYADLRSQTLIPWLKTLFCTRNSAGEWPIDSLDAVSCHWRMLSIYVSLFYLPHHWFNSLDLLKPEYLSKSYFSTWYDIRQCTGAMQAIREQNLFRRVGDLTNVASLSPLLYGWAWFTDLPGAAPPALPFFKPPLDGFMSARHHSGTACLLPSEAVCFGQYGCLLCSSCFALSGRCPTPSPSIVKVSSRSPA